MRRRLRLPDQSREVATKSDATIDRETALKWAGRAVACYQRYAATGKIRWLLRAENHEHEAMEHAALVGDRGKTLRAVQDELERARRSG
jgi:hypothetical protein